MFLVVHLACHRKVKASIQFSDLQWRQTNVLLSFESKQTIHHFLEWLICNHYLKASNFTSLKEQWLRLWTLLLIKLQHQHITQKLLPVAWVNYVTCCLRWWKRPKRRCLNSMGDSAYLCGIGIVCHIECIL